jgi:hypothetical protein
MPATQRSSNTGSSVARPARITDGLGAGRRRGFDRARPAGGYRAGPRTGGSGDAPMTRLPARARPVSTAHDGGVERPSHVLLGLPDVTAHPLDVARLSDPARQRAGRSVVMVLLHVALPQASRSHPRRGIGRAPLGRGSISGRARVARRPPHSRTRPGRTSSHGKDEHVVRRLGGRLGDDHAPPALDAIEGCHDASAPLAPPRRPGAGRRGRAAARTAEPPPSSG